MNNDIVREIAPEIDIAMSVYNGASWLDDMITSITRQTFKNWRLLIWNDGSTDDTGEKLSTWQQRHPEKISIIPNIGNINLGVCDGFNSVLKETSAPYVMLADGDDIWLPNKISLSHRAMRDAEAKQGAALPLLIHTDLTVVDSKNRKIHKSVWALVRRRPESDQHLSQIVFQAFVYGPTTIMNRALLNLALPIPKSARS